MSSIRERVTKKCHSDPRVTIDTLHSNLVSELDESVKSEYYLENGLCEKVIHYDKGNIEQISYEIDGYVEYYKNGIKVESEY